MNQLLTFLAGSGITFITVLSAIQFFVGKKVDSKFNENLATHKHSLDVVTESVKHNYQKEIHGYSLYINKRHEVYPLFYRRLVEVHADLVRRIESYPDLRDMNEEKCIEFFYQYSVDEETISDIFAKYPDRFDRGNKLFDLINKCRFTDLSNQFAELNNYFYIHELYFSEEAFKLGQKIVQTLSKRLTNKEIIVYDKVSRREFRESSVELELALEDDINQLKDLLRLEMQSKI